MKRQLTMVFLAATFLLSGCQKKSPYFGTWKRSSKTTTETITIKEGKKRFPPTFKRAGKPSLKFVIASQLKIHLKKGKKEHGWSGDGAIYRLQKKRFLVLYSVKCRAYHLLGLELDSLGQLKVRSPSWWLYYLVDQCKAKKRKRRSWWFLYCASGQCQKKKKKGVKKRKGGK